MGLVLGHDPLSGEPVYRPGSGVVDGTGTAEDPYLIAGWCILAGDLYHEITAIRLDATSAHVVIEENDLRPPDLPGIRTDGEKGVYLRNVANVTLASNQIAGFEHGIELESARDVTVQHNSFEDTDVGVVLRQSSHATVSQNGFHTHVAVAMRTVEHVTVTGNRAPTGDGVIASDARHLHIRENELAGAFAAHLEYVEDVTVAQNELDGFDAGVFAEEASRLAVSDNEITGELGGITVTDAQDVSLLGNRVDILDDEEARGIRVVNVDHFRIEENEVSGGEIGIVLDGSENGTVVGNSVTGSDYLFSGTLREHYVHVVDGNTIDGKPFFYVFDEEDVVVPPDAGQVVLVGVRGALLSGLSFANLSTAARIISSEDIVVERSLFEGNRVGLRIDLSERVEVRDSLFLDNQHAGAQLAGVDGGHVSGNRFLGSGSVRLTVGGHGILVERNTLTGGDEGILLFGPPEGSGINTVRANVIQDAWTGILVFASAQTSTIQDNNIHGNGNHGIEAYADAGEPALDARDNWWGCAEGPGDPACDGVSGNIAYDPWRTAPNPDAGAP